MKKLFISILVLLPALTMQAQNVLTPQQQLEKAQKELEDAKKALEEAKIQAETAKTKAEADKIKAEAEKVKAEAEKVKAKTNAQQTQSTSGWAIPTAEPKKTEVKKVEKMPMVPYSRLMPNTWRVPSLPMPRARWSSHLIPMPTAKALTRYTTSFIST